MTTTHYGLDLKQGDTGDRLAMQCPHQNGLLYMVPAEKSWVCETENRHAHVLAGFFKELAALEDPRVHEIMNRWGLYYRERQLEGGEE